MPIKESAKKALKQSLVRRERNLKRKKLLKNTVKKTESEKDLAKAQSTIDKIAKSGFIHKNKAARLKSRLAKKIAKSLPADAAPAGNASRSDAGRHQALQAGKS